MIPPCAVDRKAPYAVRARIEHDIHLRVIRVHRRKRQYAPLHLAVGRETRIIEQPAPAAALRAAVEPVPLRAVHAVDVHDPVQEQIVRLLLLPRAGAGFVGYIFRAVRAQRRREAAFKQLLLFFAHLPGKGLVAGRLRAVTQSAKRGILVAGLLIGLGELAVRVGVLGINFNRRLKGQNGLLIIALGQVAHAKVVFRLPVGRFVRRFGRQFGCRCLCARGKRQQQQRCQKDIKEAFHIDSPIAYRFPVRAGSRVPDLHGFYHVIKRDLAVEIYIRVDPQLCQRGHV